MGQDFDTISAAEIRRDDNIEFPAGNPDVKWHFDENRAARPPCDQPGVQWYVEALGEPILGSPLGDLYTFTVKEVGGGRRRRRSQNQGPCARPPPPATIGPAIGPAIGLGRFAPHRYRVDAVVVPRTEANLVESDVAVQRDGRFVVVANFQIHGAARGELQQLVH